MASTTVHEGTAGMRCKSCGAAVSVGQRVTYRYSVSNGVTHERCPARAPVAAPVLVSVPESDRAALVAAYGEEQVTRHFGPANAVGPETLLGGCTEPDIDS